jgi:hypothetical protein|tara:strand:+ start:174 stop:335 length:162 start_codon:yes stop_codon:yes gene_type:complete
MRSWEISVLSEEDIVDKIKCLRQVYPNLTKDKLHPLLKDFCDKHNEKKYKGKV